MATAARGRAPGGLRHRAGGTAPAADPRLLAGVIFGQLGAAPEPRDFYAELPRPRSSRAPIVLGASGPAEFDGLLLPGGHAPGMRQYLGSPVCSSRSRGSGRWAGRSARSATACWCWRAPATRPRAAACWPTASTTCLPKYMERSAYLTDRLAARPLLPHVSGLRRGRGRGRAGRPGRQFRRGPRTLSRRGTATDDTAAFVVEDRNYLSARWPGDAYLFGRRFCDLLSGGGS